jgi:hypothetical protein
MMNIGAIIHIISCYAIFLCCCYLCSGRSAFTSYPSTIKAFPSKRSAIPSDSSSKPSKLTVQKLSNKLILSNSVGKSISLHIASNGSLIIESQDFNADSLKLDSKSQAADAVYGIYEFSYGSYLALITSSEPALSFLNEHARKVRELTLLPIPSLRPNNRSMGNNLNDRRNQQDIENLLLSTFSKHSFYYSDDPSYRITKTSQENRNLQTAASDHPTWTSEDRTFFWNYNLNHAFISQGLSSWITPVTNAWADHRSVNVRGKNVTMAVISRRSSKRQGLRYIKRGTNEDGDVANFALTEQLMQIQSNATTAEGDDHPITTSFIQLRGSIPLFWHQPDIWKLKPSIQIEKNLTAHIESLRKHLHSIVVNYLRPSGKVSSNIFEIKAADRQINSLYFLNLVDKKGSQGKLGQTLSYCFEQLSSRRKKAGRSLVSSNPNPTWTWQSFIDFIKRLGFTSSSGAIDKNVDDGQEKIDVKDNWKDAQAVTTIDQALPIDNQAATQVKYIWLDYHHKVKHQGVSSALHEIYSTIRPSFQRDVKSETSRRQTSPSSYYMMDENSKCTRTQSSIIRTNCIDCLDRTNVAQVIYSDNVPRFGFFNLAMIVNADINRSMDDHPSI